DGDHRSTLSRTGVTVGARRNPNHRAIGSRGRVDHAALCGARADQSGPGHPRCRRRYDGDRGGGVRRRVRSASPRPDMNAATRPAAVAEPTSRHSAARDSATVAGWTLVSRVTGLLRILTIGAVLGPTYFANIFQAAYVLPSLIYTLIAGPVLAMVVVPGLVR